MNKVVKVIVAVIAVVTLSYAMSSANVEEYKNDDSSIKEMVNNNNEYKSTFIDNIDDSDTEILRVFVVAGEGSSKITVKEDYGHAKVKDMKLRKHKGTFTSLIEYYLVQGWDILHIDLQEGVIIFKK